MTGDNIKDSLWTRNFSLLCIGNLFLSISVYMLLPVLSLWLAQSCIGLTSVQTGVVIALSAFAVILLGPFYAYLIDTYKRKYVSVMALLIVAVSTLLIPLADTYIELLILRVIQGAMYGLAIMTTGSTLVIDVASSFRRTDANNAFAWFARLSLSLGALTGIILYQYFDINVVTAVSAGLSVLASILISMIRVPFRAPLDPPVFSLDRFMLLRGWPVAVNILLLASVLGLLLATIHTYEYYVYMMVGFVISLFTAMYLFTPKRMFTQIFVGLSLIGLGVLWTYSVSCNLWMLPCGAMCVGCGLGLSAYCFLVFLIKLSEHCQRGTANSTYYLSWEIGIACGILLGYSYTPKARIIIGLGLAFITLLFYLIFVKYWFKRYRVK